MAKILIVDDEPRIRDLIREHLQYAGFVCEEAGDGGARCASPGAHYRKQQSLFGSLWASKRTHNGNMPLAENLSAVL